MNLRNLTFISTYFNTTSSTTVPEMSIMPLYFLVKSYNYSILTTSLYDTILGTNKREIHISIAITIEVTFTRTHIHTLKCNLTENEI